MDESDVKQASSTGDPERTRAPEVEDAEQRWLRTRETDPSAPPPSAELARAYEQLERMLSELPAVPGEAAWHADVLRAARAQRRGRGRAPWMLGGGLAVAAVAALLAVQVLTDSAPPAAAEAELLAVKLEDAGRTRGGSHRGVVGGRLIASGRVTSSAGELRVYRGQRLVARCPVGPRCAGSSSVLGTHVVDVGLDAPVTYHVLLALGEGAAVAPLEPMDAYLQALGSEAELRVRAIDVR